MEGRGNRDFGNDRTVSTTILLLVTLHREINRLMS